MSTEAIGWGFAALLYIVGIDLTLQFVRVVDRRDEYLPASPLEAWLIACAWPFAMVGARLMRQIDRIRGKV